MAMLKRDELTSVPAATGDLNALLGRGSEFEGKLTFEGTVRIDGKFTGTIVTNDVLVVARVRSSKPRSPAGRSSSTGRSTATSRRRARSSSTTPRG